MRPDPRQHVDTVARMLRVCGAMDLSLCLETLKAKRSLSKGVAADAIRLTLNAGRIRMIRVGDRFIFAEVI